MDDMVFMVTPLHADARTKDLVKPCMPALAATWLVRPNAPLTADALMIRP